MFSGSWKESNMMEINLEIPDQNIDTEGWRQMAEVSTLAFHVVVVVVVVEWSFFCVYLKLCKSCLGPSTGMMCWSSPAGLSVFSLLLVCYSWSVRLKVLAACKYAAVFCCQSHGLLWSTGWIDPAVWRDDEGKHQHQDRVWLLRLRQHLWAGLSYEEVRVKLC